jgi:hypothetical protein
MNSETSSVQLELDQALAHDIAKLEYEKHSRYNGTLFVFYLAGQEQALGAITTDNDTLSIVESLLTVLIKLGARRRD